MKVCFVLAPHAINYRVTSRDGSCLMLGMMRETTSLPNDYRYHEAKPVFFGHYWLMDAPQITAANAACLDFSVARGKYLTAYRWSGERDLTKDSLVSVPAMRPEESLGTVA